MTRPLGETEEAVATGRIRTGLMVGAGVAAGFLAAVLLEDVPRSDPDRVAAPESDPVEPARRGWPTPRLEPGDAREASPPRTLTEILRLPGEFTQTAALYRLVAEADAAAVEALVDQAESLPPGSDRRAALSILYARYADLDPTAALAHLRRRGDDVSLAGLRAVFGGWARSDLEAATAAAAELPARLRVPAGTAMLISRDDLSVEARRDLAQRLDLEDVLPRIAMMQTVEQGVQDPRAAWQAALGAGGGSMSQARLSAVAQAWARQDPVAAMEAVTALRNPSMQQMLQHQVLHEWSRRNPAEAVDWVMSRPPSPARRQQVATALAGLAASDPYLALEMAQGLSGAERDQALGRVLSRWAENDPAAAAASLSLLGDGRAQRNAMGPIAAAYARRDPVGALEWLAGMAPEASLPATAMMFSVLTNQDPLQAGTLVSRLPDPQSRRLAARSVAQVWARQDPEAAARWVDTLGDAGVRREAAASLVGQWSAFDRDAALRYAERLPEPTERDAAMVAVIQAHHGDVAFAERLFDRLSVPEQRATAARLLYFNLRERDPQRAERYRELAGQRVDGPGLIPAPVTRIDGAMQ